MYLVILKDKDGYEITRTSEERLSDARKSASYFLTPVYASRMGTSHGELSTYKVEIVKNDECVWDKFI